MAEELAGDRRDGRELADLDQPAGARAPPLRLGGHPVATTAAEAWAGGVGVCQDYAHCMLALARLCGLSARYVSGHLLGEGGTHAWVEVLVPHPREPEASRAVAFDPTHVRRAGLRYVTVAVGRDYADVAPTSGTYEGPSEGELTTQQARGRDERGVPPAAAAPPDGPLPTA